jgi:hypothetical protein
MRAAVFDPSQRMDWADGPMNTIPASAHAAAKSAFYAQIAFRRRRRADVLGFIRQADVQRAPVGI